jgi:hypothetical protein
VFPRAGLDGVVNIKIPSHRGNRPARSQTLYRLGCYHVTMWGSFPTECGLSLYQRQCLGQYSLFVELSKAAD